MNDLVPLIETLTRYKTRLESGGQGLFTYGAVWALQVAIEEAERVDTLNLIAAGKLHVDHKGNLIAADDPNTKDGR